MQLVSDGIYYWNSDVSFVNSPEVQEKAEGRATFLKNVW